MSCIVLTLRKSFCTCSVRVRGAQAVPRVCDVQVSTRRGQFGPGGEGVLSLLSLNLLSSAFTTSYVPDAL